jgi:molybdenum cofactor cytidylyltransferase
VAERPHVTSYRKRLGLGDRELVALVGGGGKSTLLFALGTELAGAGRRVIVTTTTKMGRNQAALAPTICWSSDIDCVTDALDQPGPVMLLNDGTSHKVTGPPPEIVDRVFATADVDYMIVEADGSRGRPLKAPAAHEPVVPQATTTVIVLIGVDAVGRPLAAVAHRVEQAIAFSGLLPHHILTSADCAHILTHPNGILRACPETARVVVAITKVGPAEHAAASALRHRLVTHPRISDVVLIDRVP